MPESSSETHLLDRDREIRKVIDRCTRRIAAGETIRESEVLDGHAHLMPELGDVLRDLLMVEQIRRQVEEEKAPSSAAESKSQDKAAKVGTKTFAGYEIIRKIDRGGQGDVYLGRQVSTNRNVAIKILSRRVAATAGSVERFQREARAAASLDHPNIVRVYSGGETRGVHFIAFEFVDGPSLDRLLQQKAPLQEAQILEIAEATAEALQHAHAHGVLHRDVKPGNILVTPDGIVKLTDFGLAKYGATQLAFQTTAGRVFGTPAFLSPEQTTGSGAVDARSDIYSLGCTMYNMATGQQPFIGENPYVVMDQHRRSAPVPIRHRNPMISGPLEMVVLRAMGKNPDHRYQTAEALIADLKMIKGALQAPGSARGGLAQAVHSLGHMKVVERHMRQEWDHVESPSWQMRVTAAFLERPLVWFGIFAVILAVCVALALLIGIWIGSGSD